MRRKDEGSGATFEVESFDWGGPDRLELRGTFTGLPRAEGEPLLVVHGDDGAHQLVPVDGSEALPRVGEPWQAAFAWQEPPAAFTTAELLLGDVRVQLPGLGRQAEAAQTLAVVAAEAAEPAPARRLHLEAELLSAQERAHALERELVRVRAGLERATADLEAERAGREEDAARFHIGLADVERAAADELEQARAHFDAVEAARAQAEQLRAELETAHARETGLREQLGEASAALEQALRHVRAAVRDRWPEEQDGRTGSQ